VEWNVWYQAEAKQVGFGYKKGTLTVEPSGATLATKDEMIELAPIRSVGRQFVSLWLNFVAVEFGAENDVRQLYMGDRGLLGWRGVFGSNDEIENALRAAASGAAPPPRP
jgi:hypothetical protein